MGIFDIDGNEIKALDYNTSFSIFESFAVIGDSFCTGSISLSDDTAGSSYYNISWPAILGRLTGAVCYNFSKGGLSTKDWLTDSERGASKMLEASPANLYVIALGINDGNQSIPIGTISDITSDSTNSFYSYYGRIVRAIKAHAPNAIIMLSTLARWSSTYNQYSEAIKNIAEYYNIGVLDLSENTFFRSEFFAENQRRSHPLAVSYAAMAEEYKFLIETELRLNASRYRSYTGTT